MSDDPSAASGIHLMKQPESDFDLWIRNRRNTLEEPSDVD